MSRMILCLATLLASFVPALSAVDLGFLGHYEDYSISNYDPNPGPHIEQYASAFTPFPDFPGEKLALVEVALFPLVDKPLNDVPEETPPSEFLNQAVVFAEVVDSVNGNLEIPGNLVGDTWEGFLDNLPETAEGVQFMVTLPPSTENIPFYTRGVADVTLKTKDVIQEVRSQLEEAKKQVDARFKPAVLRAKSNARTVKKIYGKYFQKADKAEDLAKRAKEAFDRGNLDQASKLLERAENKLEDVVESLEEASKAAEDASTALEGIPGLEGIVKSLKVLSKLLKALAEIIRAHFWLYVLTFFDTPKVKINVCSDGTYYSQKAMKIHLEPGDEKDPSVIIHEYGHVVMSKATNETLPAGPHVPNKNSSEELAWSEGWATFFSSAVRNDSSYTDTDITTGTNLTMDVEDNTVNGNNVTEKGKKVEANVQSALWDIVDGPSSGLPDRDNDGLSVPFSTVWNCIVKSKPDTFCEFLDCLKKELTDAQKTALDKVLKMNNIDPKP